MQDSDLQGWRDQALIRLRARAGRHSQSRVAVIDYLARRPACLSVAELVEGMRVDGRPVSTATAYRTLEVLEEQECVHAHDIGDGSLRYEPTYPDGPRRSHHHHLVCTVCHDVTLFEHPPLEQMLAAVSRELDFAASDHEVVLRGTCRRCRAVAGQAAPDQAAG